jgi:hypothetical protein
MPNARKRRRQDIVHDPLPSPHLHELAELWRRGCPRREFRCHRVHLLAPRRRVVDSSLERTCRAIRIAAMDGSSCSQTRITSQPRSLSRRVVSASRSLLASIFSRQNFALAFGQVPCFGQPCQKQPSTNTAIRARRNTISARRGESSNGFASIEYRRPIAWSSFRTRNSAGVSRCGVDRIRIRTASDEAGGWGTFARDRLDVLALGRTSGASMCSRRPADIVG